MIACERNITAVSRQPRIKPASAFSTSTTPTSPSGSPIARDAEDHYGPGPGLGEPPLPPKDNPEMALLIAGFSDTLEAS
jgi:hypothetical protein